MENCCPPWTGGKSYWCNVSSWAEEALQSFVSLTAEQREQLRVDKIKERKEQIASLASAIISDPHSNVRPHQRLLQVPPSRPALFTCCSAFQMKRLKELRGMMMERDPCVAVTIRKLVMVSLMEIFKDIAPTYRIRPLTSAEKAAKVMTPPPPGLDAMRATAHLCRSVQMLLLMLLKVKKQTQQLRQFEEGLLSQYKFYLEDLEQTIKGG